MENNVVAFGQKTVHHYEYHGDGFRLACELDDYAVPAVLNHALLKRVLVAGNVCRARIAAQMERLEKLGLFEGE